MSYIQRVKKDNRELSTYKIIKYKKICKKM